MLDLTKPMQTRMGTKARYAGKLGLCSDLDYPYIFEFLDQDDKPHYDFRNEHGTRERGLDPDYDIINVPEFKLEANKFYWTKNEKIMKIFFLNEEHAYGINIIEIIQNKPNFSGDITRPLSYQWKKSGMYNLDLESHGLDITRELTQQELEEYGLLGK